MTRETANIARVNVARDYQPWPGYQHVHDYLLLVKLALNHARAGGRVRLFWGNEALDLDGFRREFRKALGRRILLKGALPRGRNWWDHYQLELRRDARQLREMLTTRIRHYSFRTDLMRKRFGHLLADRSEVMTFKEFQDSRKPATVHEMDDAAYPHDMHTTGLLYSGMYVIEDTQAWPDVAREKPWVKRYYLLLCNEEYFSDDLAELERRLYEFAFPEPGPGDRLSGSHLSNGGF